MSGIVFQQEQSNIAIKTSVLNTERSTSLEVHINDQFI